MILMDRAYGGNSSHICFWHQAISDHFSRWPPKKLVGTITYEPFVGLHSYLVGYWDNC